MVGEISLEMWLIVAWDGLNDLMSSERM